MKSEEDRHGGRAAPGLLRSLHQGSDQQRSEAQQGDTQSSYAGSFACELGFDCTLKIYTCGSKGNNIFKALPVVMGEL